MPEVKLRVRTSQGVYKGCYETEDTNALSLLEHPQSGLHALEQALCASRLQIDPFAVIEASVFFNNLTYHYTTTYKQ